MPDAVVSTNPRPIQTRRHERCEGTRASQTIFSELGLEWETRPRHERLLNSGSLLSGRFEHVFAWKSPRIVHNRPDRTVRTVIPNYSSGTKFSSPFLGRLGQPIRGCPEALIVGRKRSNGGPSGINRPNRPNGVQTQFLYKLRMRATFSVSRAWLDRPSDGVAAGRTNTATWFVRAMPMQPKIIAYLRNNQAIYP
jgi:hypothetical protein